MKTTSSQNVYSDFGLDIPVFEMQKQSVLQNFLSNLDVESLSSELQQKINEAFKSGKLEISIPSDILDKIKNGKEFITKLKNKDLPKIIIKSGKNGSSVLEIDPNKVKEALLKMDSSTALITFSIYAFYDAVNGLMNKMDDIIQQLHNDRFAECVAAINNYQVLSLDKKCDQRKIAQDAYIEINRGLTKIHLEIDELVKEIQKMPKNDLETAWQTIKHPFTYNATKNDEKICSLFNTLLFYGKTLCFADMLLQQIDSAKSTTMIVQNRAKYVNMMNRYTSDSNLIERITYIIRGDMPQLYKLLKNDENMSAMLTA